MVYTYICNDCRYKFEIEHSILNVPESERCPVCDAYAHLFISGGNGFILKGTGFHANDYPKEGK